MMELGSNTVLVTGGASGIGLGIAKEFIRAGSVVIICGRREEKLREAKEQCPQLHTYMANVETPEGRVKLRDWMLANFPNLNIVVNNAGIQRRLQLSEQESWENTAQEIAINFEAPVHVSQLFVPHLQKQAHAAIINITSGLAFAPMSRMPVYCATKAALHSFTMSLRHQLAATSVKVLEIIPPAVNTDLGGPGLHTFGVPVDKFVSSVMSRIAAGELEVGFETSENSRRASREQLDQAFLRMNS